MPTPEKLCIDEKHKPGNRTGICETSEMYLESKSKDLDPEDLRITEQKITHCSVRTISKI
jgi:hypothetical protein